MKDDGKRKPELYDELENKDYFWNERTEKERKTNSKEQSGRLERLLPNSEPDRKKEPSPAEEHKMVEIYDPYARAMDEDHADYPRDREDYSEESGEDRPARKGKVSEDLYSQSDGVKHRKRKSRGCMVAFLWVFIIGAISIFLALNVIFAISDFVALGRSGSCEVKLTEDMTLDELAGELKEAGAIDHPFYFKLFVSFKKDEGSFKEGLYVFDKSLGYTGIVNLLKQGGTESSTVQVRIEEGATVDEIAAALEEHNVCKKEEFLTAVNKGEFRGADGSEFLFMKEIPTEKVHYRLEGYLYPDTYEFYTSETENSAQLAIQKILENFDSKLTESYYTYASEMDMTMHEIITMASIVELECNGRPDEMYKVAAVFYNRLNWADQPALLGSTPTAEYPYGDGEYDTNVHEGLPPGPVCSPTVDAIKAALFPEKDFEAEYFVTSKDGQFYYNNTLEEHNSTIADLEAAGLWES